MLYSMPKTGNIIIVYQQFKINADYCLLKVIVILSPDTLISV